MSQRHALEVAGRACAFFFQSIRNGMWFISWALICQPRREDILLLMVWGGEGSDPQKTSDDGFYQTGRRQE